MMQSQYDLFGDDDENSLEELGVMDTPPPKRQRASTSNQGPSPFEKKVLGLIQEGDKRQKELATTPDETAEELFGKSIGKKLAELKNTHPAGVEWAQVEIQRILYHVQFPQQHAAPAQVVDGQMYQNL